MDSLTRDHPERNAVPKIQVILNPTAGRGYGARIAPVIEDELARLDADYALVVTSSSDHVVRMVRQAMDDGFDTIVAAGGDGTTHEVVNAMLSHSDGQLVGTLGCIPAGSGNDFAEMNGAPRDVAEACRLIVEHNTRVIDVCHATIDNDLSFYFDNTMGIGFDGLVTLGSRKHKHLRGMALYLPVVIRTILRDLVPPRVEITYDDHTIHQTIMMAIVCNGPREGASFLVAPDAQNDDGFLDLLIAETMSKAEMLAVVPRFMNGSHLQNRHIVCKRAKHVVISSEDPLYLHADGELPCEVAHRVEATVLPGRLRIIAPSQSARA